MDRPLGEEKEYHFLFHKGGLGDLIGQLPAVKYALDYFPNIKINMWVHDYAVSLCQKALPYNQCVVHPISALQESTVTGMCRSPYFDKIGNLSNNITDHAFFTLLGTSVEDKYKSYVQMSSVDVSDFNLPEKYVVVTTGFTSLTRMWKASIINEVCDYIIAKRYTPVFIGKAMTQAIGKVYIKGNFDSDYSKGINLIDKTTLLEAHGIMSNSICTIGVDNGLLHLSCMGSAPSVWGFTTVEPRHRIPYNSNTHVVYPDKKELSCIGCQSNMNFIESTHAFTTCKYNDLKCIDLITADKWIAQLEKIL